MKGLECDGYVVRVNSVVVAVFENITTLAQLNQIFEMTSASNEGTYTTKTEACKNNEVVIKRCSWPLGTCVTHFSSKTENTPVNMLSTRSDVLKKKRPSEKKCYEQIPCQ